MPGNVRCVLRFAARVVLPPAAGAAEHSVETILTRAAGVQNALELQLLWLIKMLVLHENAYAAFFHVAI